jgi:hypothetical protein
MRDGKTYLPGLRKSVGAGPWNMAVVSAPGLVEKSYLVLILFVLNALPFLLGTQPAVLNSLKNIESLQGDPNKQILLLVLYAVGAILLFWRVGLKRAFQLGAPLLRGVSARDRIAGDDRSGRLRGHALRSAGDDKHCTARDRAGASGLAASRDHRSVPRI